MVQSRFGGPEVLELQDLPTPVPGPGEVTLRVRAVSVNPTLDFAVRAGSYAKPVDLPHILGVDPSGTIEAVGEGVEGFAPGDRVATTPWVRKGSKATASKMLGVQAWGGCAEVVRIRAEQAHHLPKNVGFAEASVILRHAPLGVAMLRTAAALKPGEHLLVTGPLGGLGNVAIQIGRNLGASVIPVMRGGRQSDWLMAQGFDPIVLGENPGDLAQSVLRRTEGRGADVALETTGDAALFEGVFASLGRHGRLITAGGPAAGAAPIDIKRLYLNQLTIKGHTAVTSDDVTEALALAAANRIAPRIDHIAPLEDAPEIHRTYERGEMRGRGKVILDPGLPPA
ncbi:zinc-binding alcohol dehydrogenase family protein [Oceanicola sp. D3]|uniref:quinone oxidoreductase family protein n=1 Tax=Oceanicola sp. D3 TaxID=2587163 RepID=UPI001AEFA0FA|nr:zinc-binding alcohol dehydrogenase family protein [Oceanicola sp. D3]